MTSKHSDQRGFTLIEILVVIVILSILGGLAAQTLHVNILRCGGRFS